MVRAVANDHHKVGKGTRNGNSNKIVVWRGVLRIRVRLECSKGMRNNRGYGSCLVCQASRVDVKKRGGIEEPLMAARRRRG